MNVDELTPRLRCLTCKSSLAVEADLRCTGCGEVYRIVRGRPVLLARDNPLFPPAAYEAATPNRPAPSLTRWLPSPSVNLSSDRVLRDLASRLAATGGGTILVVGGGTQRRWLDAYLSAASGIRAVYCDIDAGADVDLFCDAHALPFADASFDGVVTTAVLEHVMYPEQAAREIARVVRVGGYLYSELPFMQQVHEGAYDFTRYTLSGHRRLFADFAEIQAGMVAGPGTAFVWALENLFLSFATSGPARKVIKAICRLCFFWIKYADKLLERTPAAMDAASCTYLLGQRQPGRIPDAKIIETYVGAKTLTHV